MRSRTISCLAWILFLVAASGSWVAEAYGQSAARQPAASQSAARQRGLTPVDSDAKPSATATIGPYYALVIGNNDYLKLNKLQTAVNDATAIAQLLQTSYGFSTKLLRNASRNDILTAFAEYRRTLPENANLLIYYAGHGFEDKEAGTAYWLPINAEANNNENWISADDITTAVHVMPALHVLIVSDSCYSGDLTRGAFDINLGSNANFLSKMLKSRSRTLLASGGDEPVADGGANGHSVFAGALIQNLNQIKDAQFTGNSLFQKIQQQVGGLSRTSQVPHYETIRGSQRETGDDGDFVFSRNSGATGSGVTGSGVPVSNVPVAAAGPELDSRDLDTRIDEPQTRPTLYGNAANQGDTQSDVDEINAVLKKYLEAHNHLDAKALWEIWPTADPKERKRIEDLFSRAKSVQYSVAFGAPTINADGVTATVSGLLTLNVTPKDGNPSQRSPDGVRDVITLKKVNGKWLIDSRQ